MSQTFVSTYKNPMWRPVLASQKPVWRPVLAPQKRGLGQYGGAPTILMASVLLATSVGISAYHGYKRNDSAGWGLWWGLMGLLFPIAAPAVAITQGYGKAEK